MENHSVINAKDLQTLNQILKTLNETLDIRAGLNAALAQIIQLLDLETGWIFIHKSLYTREQDQEGFKLAAYHNLPPEMNPETSSIWDTSCTCQECFLQDRFIQAYNEIRCSRLKALNLQSHSGIHASVPLKSGDITLGILNLTTADWRAFQSDKLALLENLGHQVGVFLDRTRLYNLLHEQRLSEQEVLLDVSRQLLSRSDPVELADYIVLEVRSLLACDACALLLPDRGNMLAFRAASGWLFDPVKESRSIPNDQRTGPGMAMISQKPIVIRDLQDTSEALWTEPWLEREGMRGHTIVPLILENRSIGALVINHRTPRLFEEDEIRLLQLMANQVAIALEKAQLQLDTVERQRLEHELKLAHSIQQNMLPLQCPSPQGWQFAAAYRPAREIGGDFYDFYEFPTEPDLLGIVIADVTDKGIPAALFMASSRTILRTIAFSGRDPAAALARANDLIMRDGKTDTFISAFYALANTRTGRIRYASAGHNPPLLFRAADNSIQTLDARGIVLGVVEIAQFEQKTVYMQPGDAIVFFTDGVTDAVDTQKNLYGQEQLVECLQSCGNQDADRILESILDRIDQYSGSAPRSDDLTMVVARYTAS
ncbi:MAG: SpoIIE family protein phosphatase [Anaerolineales bacterium]|nr:SpoIIE family protein phosphatase [Anaerolineales bacterium]